MENDLILELKEIKKSFGETDVLRGISIGIRQGEFITFLGPSGCGKTTTLRIIAGLEEPDSGRVILEGKDVTALAPNRRDVNTVFQSYALFPHMNVEQNVAYSLRLRKVGKREQKQAVEEVLEQVQLSGYQRRMPSELSGGQRQRVAIARALVNHPRVLLLDEPLGALDLQLRRQMQVELKRLQKRLGITFLYITHDQEEALNMSDRIVVMKEGVFRQIGSPAEVYDHPSDAFVARFVGSANILREGAATLAVRSEHIRFAKDGPGIPATVKEKSFTGGMLRITFSLEDGSEVVASRHGIDLDIHPGERRALSWEKEHAAAVKEDDEG